LQNLLVSGSGTAVASRFASKRSSFLVASGIFLSRVAGLIRDRVFAHYFGNSDAADAFKAAFRIPNALQNLFGEGVLSASFIPVYAALLAREEDEEARRTAGAVAALLALSTSILVLFGVLATPYLIDAIAPGFSGEKRELTIRIVRILFPGAGLFVFSAWCLGILNSHRRFFLSYTAPVIWNAAMIATLWGFGARYTQFSLAIVLSWGSVVGAALMVAIQLPVVLGLLKGLHLSFAFHLENVRTVVRNFFPVFISRGVVQISAYVDALLASLLPTGAVAALAYAQTLYTLPVSLFGMSVSAAELPAMSGAVGAESEVAQCRVATNCIFRDSLGGSISCFGRCDCSRHLSVRPVHPRGCKLCLGNFGGIDGGTPGVHSRAPLFLNLLCVERYADASELCHHTRRLNDDPRISFGDSVTARFGN
jgi:putative peptidoglycan lipid II flippase